MNFNFSNLYIPQKLFDTKYPLTFLGSSGIVSILTFSINVMLKLTGVLWHRLSEIVLLIKSFVEQNILLIPLMLKIGVILICSFRFFQLQTFLFFLILQCPFLSYNFFWHMFNNLKKKITFEGIFFLPIEKDNFYRSNTFIYKN